MEVNLGFNHEHWLNRLWQFEIKNRRMRGRYSGETFERTLVREVEEEIDRHRHRAEGKRAPPEESPGADRG
jgi:hypothetical protein